MLRVRSFAKVNLHLEVVRRREDGYHELRTLFQTIDLADELELEAIRSSAGEVRIEVSGADLPADERNLAVRAAREFLREWGPSGAGVAIRLVKRIPAGGGLGGGSSNAAAVLTALGRLFGREPESAAVEAVARRLGADVPFFLVGGTALGTGRGDRIEPLPDPPGGPLELWLVTPEFELSTPAVFAALGAGSEARPPRGPVARLLAGERPATLLELVGENDLEAAAFRLRPELAAVYTALESSGAIRTRLSGSGSTLFACFEDPDQGRAAARALPPGFRTRRVATLSRARWEGSSGAAPLEGG
jgi:4-diphosphocytidyl-2-C-methyl-D-erythritol kinase